MAEKENKELKPFVLKFATQPELYAASIHEKGQLDTSRAEKLKLTDLIKLSTANCTTCAITTEYWSGEQTDFMIDWPCDD